VTSAAELRRSEGTDATAQALMCD